MKETFGEYIQKLRGQNSLTLTQLSASLEIDQSTLSKIENGKRKVTKEILPKLAQVFNLDVEKLEQEFYSEKIAEMIYLVPNSTELLTLAEKKANYYKLSKINTGI